MQAHYKAFRKYEQQHQRTPPHLVRIKNRSRTLRFHHRYHKFRGHDHVFATITYPPCLNSKSTPDHVIAATCSTKSSSNFRQNMTTKPNLFASTNAIARLVRKWVTSTCAPSTLLSTTFSYHQTRKILATIAASRKSTGGISARNAGCAS